MNRLFFVCALAALFSFPTFGQSPSQAATAFFLQTDIERGYVLCPSGNGTIYLVGMTDVDMVLMEIGTEGEILSSRYVNVGITDLDVAVEIMVDSEDKLVICGNLKEDSPNNGFVFRYDPVTRKALWAKTFTVASVVQGILENGPGGNFVLYCNPHHVDGDDAEWLLLDRNSGNIVPGAGWRYDLGQSENFNAQVVYQNHLYAVGRFTDGPGMGDMRQALLKIDPATGQPLWARLGYLPPAADARLFGRDLLIDQDAIISTFSGNDSGTDEDVSQVFLQKTNLDGDLEWVKKIDLTEWNTEFAEEIVSVPDGYVLFGRPLSAAENALFIFKTDKNGNLVWARKFQYDNDKGRITGAAQGQLIVLGDNLYATGYTEKTSGIRNMFLLKIGADGRISDSCTAFLPTAATVTNIPDPVHYDIIPTVEISATGLVDLPVAPSVPFFPDKTFICRQIISTDCEDLPDPQFPDTTICSGQSLTYSVPGFDTYAWAPAAGLNCTDCAEVIIQPQAGTQYTLLATTILGCELRDTFWVEINTGPSNLTLQCPADIVQTVGANTPTATVDYNDPLFTSDCPCGAGALTLLQGLPGGSDFPVGVTQICFGAEDGCTTQASCCFTVTVEQMATDDEPCDVKETTCLRFEILSISQYPSKQRTFRMRVVNKCPEPLQYIAFQLPNGISADQPPTNSVYTAPSGRQYEVRNPNAAPFHSIRFRSTGTGISGGASDIFEYTLPPQANPTFIGAIARLAPQQFYETHLNVFACEVRQVIDRPAENREGVSGRTGNLRVFPNPVELQLYIDLSEWAGRQLRLSVQDVRGVRLTEMELEATSEPYVLAIPEAWPKGVYFLSVINEAGVREHIRLLKLR